MQRSSFWIYLVFLVGVFPNISHQIEDSCLAEDDFLCYDGLRCLNINKKCDRKIDCLDGSDEEGCSEDLCNSGQFKCKKSGKCINLSWVCDGSPDCSSQSDNISDESDEDSNLCNTHVECLANYVSCKDNTTCLHMSNYCDGHIDCPDNSDEGPQCSLKSCDKSQCSHNCAITWRGPKCFCEHGKTIDPKNQHFCIDENECEKEETCDQICQNKPGTFVCSCFEGFELDPENKTRCKGKIENGKESMLMFSNSLDIRFFSLNGSASSKYPIVAPETVALDFDYRNNSFCWISKSKIPAMTCKSFNNSIDTWILPQPGPFSFLNIVNFAYDWVSKNYYFLDDYKECVILCSLKESFFDCKSLYTLRHLKPQGIALDPMEGVLFFSAWSSQEAKISKSRLSGSNLKVLAHQNVVYPYGVTLDHFHKYVYWVEEYHGVVERINYDGGNRIIVKRSSESHSLYSLTIFENSIFLSSWKNRSILKVSRFKTEPNITILINNLRRTFSLKIFHKTRQPLQKDNPYPCRSGKCEHFCIPTKEAPFYECICKSGYVLTGKYKCTIPNESNYLIYAIHKPGAIHGVALDGSETEAISPILDVRRPTALDVNSKDGLLYIADSGINKILEYNLKTGVKRTLTETGVKDVLGIGVDSIANNLYWTDERSIFVSSLKNPTKIKTIAFDKLRHPRSLVVDPISGHVYWTDWPLGSPDINKGSIERSKLDGSERSVIVSENIVWANSLCISLLNDEKRLFWVDTYLAKIESIDTATLSKRKVHLSKENSEIINQPYGFTVIKGSFYWSEFETGVIRVWSPKNKGSIFKKEYPLVFSLKFYDPKNFRLGPACPRECDEFCFFVNQVWSCDCSDGYALTHDGKCEQITDWKPPSNCKEDHFECRNKKCIDFSYKCDGENDCGDNSDEDPLSACLDTDCSSDQFKCKNGIGCVSNYAKCNGEKDCIDGSDESSEICPHKSCNDSNNYICEISRRCISKSWICDGHRDCGLNDTSDESNCFFEGCLMNEHKCDDSSCILLSYVCDGHNDCKDGSDEQNCRKFCDENGFFYCEVDEKCLPSHQRCNGDIACSDGSDEMNCDQVHKCKNPHHFPCSSGQCILEQLVCDGISDCKDGSDEIGCSNSVSEFFCPPSFASCAPSEKRCIPNSFLCDGKFDCQDKSDEIQCPKIKNHLNCKHPSHSCLGFKNITICLEISKLCDGIPDCIDGSDEGGRCVDDVCLNNSDCSGLCAKSPKGRVCYCSPGFHLVKETECYEDYPCEEWGTCSQSCKPLSKLRHKCFCKEDYLLDFDGFSCKSKDTFSNPILLLSDLTEIRSINIRKTSKSVPVLSDLKKTSLLDFYYSKNGTIIFWIDSAEDTLYRGNLIQGSLYDVIPILKNSLISAKGLAIDWIGENIYWILSDLALIEVSDINGSNRKALIQGSLENPLGLVLDPTFGRIFWTSKSNQSVFIDSCTMTGESRKNILNITIYGLHPSGLALDYNARRIYWIDSISNSIYAVTYEGHDLKEILKGSHYLSHPYGIEIFESYLYWSNQATKSILKANKWNGSDVVILDSFLGRPMGIKIVHSSKQPVLNHPCKRNNGGCSHLCLIKNTIESLCACPYSMKLRIDTKTCEPFEIAFLISSSNHIKGVDMDNPQNYVLPVLSSHQVISMDYFSKTKLFFWIDNIANNIQRSNINGSETSILLDKNALGQTPSDIAVDQNSGNIYISAGSSVYISNFRGQFMKELFKKTKGYVNISSITLDSELGMMFWSEHNSQRSLIRTSKMDGRDSDELVTFPSKSVSVIHCLSYQSFNGRKLFYINGIERVEYWDFVKKSVQFLPSGKSPSTLALYKNFLYFSDYNLIYKMNLTDLTTKIYKDNLNKIYSMKIYDPQIQSTASNLCSVNNGGCSQLCLPNSIKYRTCACTHGYQLSRETECKEDPAEFLLISSSSHLIGRSTRPSQIESVLSSFNGLSAPKTIGAHSLSNTVFWIDGKSMYKANRDGTNKVLLFDDLHAPQRLTVDSISSNIYWTDDDTKIIEVCNKDGKYRLVLHSENLDRPFALALDPFKGILFWSDIGKTPKIESSSFNGSFRKTIVSSDVEKVTGLTIDIESRRLFWCDNGLKTIVSVNYNGEDRNYILRGLRTLFHTPNGLAFMGGRDLYFIDSELKNGSLVHIEINSRNSLRLMQSQMGSVSDIAIFKHSKRFTRTQCHTKHSCQELCLFTEKSSNSSHCICSVGKLGSDGRSCIEYDSFLAFSSVSKIEFIHISNYNNSNIPLRSISHQHYANDIGALAYDLLSKDIFYFDSQRKSINSVSFNGTDHKVLLSKVPIVEGMVYVSAIKSIFWTGESTIERLKLGRSFSTNTILRLPKNNQLRDIDVDACEGRLYFANTNIKSPSINRIWISGYGLETLIDSEIGAPNTLTFDSRDKVLFWADTRLNKIEKLYIDTGKRIVLKLIKAHHPFDLALFEDNLFFTDWATHSVMRINKYSGENLIKVKSKISTPMFLLAIHNETQEFCSSKDSCKILNGGCEDLCVVSEDGDPICACKEGRNPIDGDSRRCSQSLFACNSSTEFRCSSLDVCIPYTLTCDGSEHCPDGSDEETIYCAVRECKSSFLRCSNGKCVPNTSRCNGIDDCGDFSDEVGCPCPENDQIKCSEGWPCINPLKKCDGIRDCPLGSDEIGCPKIKCSTHNFPVEVQNKLIHCKNTTACILPEWKCDGKNDCWDNSDELFCSNSKATYSSCPKGTRSCKSGDQCISESWVCDGSIDCSDKSDEDNCTYSCSEHQFQCENGQCIPKNWYCNKVPDCDDQTDELNCQLDCHEDQEFRCNSTGVCIPSFWVCDGDKDCRDNEDEKDCFSNQFAQCRVDQFRCLNNRCIDKSFLCDANDDCGDNSDENSTCDYSRHSHQVYCCPFLGKITCLPLYRLCDGTLNCDDESDEIRETCLKYSDKMSSFHLKPNITGSCSDKFECKNGACVPWERLCDKSNDCGDFSDEISCNVNECENPYTCAHICEDKKIGYECQCHEGYKASETDPTSCDDINECQTLFPCSQICLNTDGSYKCSCQPEYELLSDGHNCKSKNSNVSLKIMYSSSYYITLTDLNYHSEVIVNNQGNAVALDFDWSENCIFWSDVTPKDSVLKKTCNFQNKEEPEVTQLATLRNPDGLAVDWISKHLYWCDKGSDTIEVSDYNGHYRKVLVDKGLQEPRGIVVDPFTGYLYWSDWGSSPHIGKAGMDGSNPHVIIEEDLGWPNALVIDYTTKKLFFGDAKHDYIAFSDMDGKNVKVVISHHNIREANLHHVFALTIFEDYVYWTDWETKTIERCKKFSGENASTVAKMLHKPMDLQIYHPLRQPLLEHNPCINNGGCEALCLLKPDENGKPSRVCACPESHILNDDNLTCKPNCSLSDFVCASTVKCIPFWWKCDGQDDCGDGSDEPSDCEPFKCQPGQFQCQNQHCVLPTQICDKNNDCGDGSDESNCEKYSCLQTQFKCPSNDTHSGFCISLNRKCNAVLDCPGGEDELDCSTEECATNHFRCQKGNCIPAVWVCDEDNDCGDNSDEFPSCPLRNCTDNLYKCPNGRCIPKVWKCDGDADCEKGEDELEDCTSKCEDSYFQCNNHRCIPSRWRCNFKDDCGDNSDELDCENLYRNCSISEVPCSGGMCIHESKLCDGKPDCNDKSDELFCQDHCSIGEFRCKSPPVCIFDEWRCDGDSDCSDNSDELGCPTTNCSLGTFSCSDGTCISSQWLCDGMSDCDDGSDENHEVCLKHPCAPGRYRCDNGQCILWSSICDGVSDCSDNSDESNLACKTNSACNQGEFTCEKEKRCVSLALVCNGIDDCGDNSDEKNCLRGPCIFGACSQTCVAKKSYLSGGADIHETPTCFCEEGYVRHEKISCKALGKDPVLLVANENVLRQIPIYINSSIFSFPSSKSRSKISSLDVYFDRTIPVLLWAIPKDKSIFYFKVLTDQRSKRSSNDKVQGLIASGIKGLKRIGVNWVTWNLFYIAERSIMVLSVDNPSSRKTILSNLDEPSDLVVDPEKGYLFYSDHGTNPKVCRCNLNGTNQIHLVESKIQWPVSLALDYPSRRLYWSDLKRRTIESVSYDGQNRVVIRKFLNNEGRPYRLQVFEDFIYLTTFKHNRLLRLNKFGLGNLTQLSEEHTAISDILLYQENKHRMYSDPCFLNSCHEDNSICIMESEKTFSCVCIDGYIRSGNRCIKSTPSETCDGILCHTGKCVITPDENGIDRAACECTNPYYTGKYCDKYFCSGHCLNGGLCFPNNPTRQDQQSKRNSVSPQCICIPQYEGDRCEIPVQPCRNQCSNRGMCKLDSKNNTNCECHNGFSGANCQQCQINPNYCFNEGICTSNDRLQCKCKPGFTGDRCHIDKCELFGECSNGGTCVIDENGDTKCLCQPDFKGKFCQTFKCDNYCLNGGTPNTQTQGQCRCDCRPGTGGLRCRNTACKKMECLNGGTCVLLNGREVCSCPPSFGGLDCSSRLLNGRVNPCDHHECHNGGICQVAVKSKKYFAKCVCPVHHAGLHCEKQNLCLNYCMNGGICHWSREDTVSCVCSEYYKGPRCAIKLRNFQGITSIDNNSLVHSQNSEVTTTVLTIFIILLSILVLGGTFFGLIVLCRRKRLGRAFKHRRIAESLLVASNVEFPNRIFNQDEHFEDTGSNEFRMETNFSNPVYDSVFRDVDNKKDDTEEEEDTVLLVELEETRCTPNESSDLLTEKHKGNISL